MTPNGSTATAPEEIAYQAVTTSPPPPPVVGNRVERRLPRRIEEIQLPEPYEDFHITAWVNYPGQLREDMRSGDEKKVSAALKLIVISHDLVDFDGKPYPPASEEAFWTEAPDDVGYAIIGAIRDRFGKLPKASGVKP
jgi:hypothetical protein